MAIVWRQQMSIDDGIIDDDHKCLIGLVNDLEAVAPSGMMPSELSLILTRLEAYAKVHFQREERLQVAVAFTYQLAHHRRHNVLLRQLNAMRLECENTRSHQQLIDFHVRLCAFLQHWLVDHVLKVDVLMKPFVAEMRKHADASSTLAEAVRISAAKREVARATAYGLLPPSAPG